MEVIGWIIAIIVLLLFGPQLLTVIQGPLSPALNAPNAVPTPNGLPASSTQNQNVLNTANAPAPWSNACSAPLVAVIPPSPSLPLAPTSIAISDIRHPVNFQPPVSAPVVSTKLYNA